MHSDDSDGPRGRDSSDDPGHWELIADYLSGEAGSDAREVVEARRRSDPRFRADLEAATLAWERAGSAVGPPVPAARTDEAWSRLSGAVHDEATIVPISRGRRTLRRPGPWRIAATAASLVLLIAMATLATRQAGTPAEVVLREVVADRGQRVAVTLSDGGRVVLAPGSTLWVREQFAAEVRTVRLAGRAYFEVVHDPARPFVVETGRVDVRVLGTAFDLRAYGEAESAEVVVRSGRVAVHATHALEPEDILLEGGARAIIEASGTVQVERNADIDALLSWTTGRLAFERMALADVVADIERWYDVSIELADPALARSRLTAAFDREPLDVILQTVATIVGARVERDGRLVTFSSPAPRN